MKKFSFLFIVCFAMLMGPSQSISAIIDYDEASDGDLLGLFSQPDFGAVDIGLNVVTGSISGLPGPGTYDGNDAFDFEMPIGLEAIFITLTVENFMFLTSPSGTVGNADNSRGNAMLDVDTYSPPFEVLYDNIIANGTFSFGTLSAGKHMINTVAGGPFGLVEYDWTYEIFVQPVQPIPEPTTLLLLGAGLIGLAGVRRKFQN